VRLDRARHRVALEDVHVAVGGANNRRGPGKGRREEGLVDALPPDQALAEEQRPALPLPEGHVLEPALQQRRGAGPHGQRQHLALPAHGFGLEHALPPVVQGHRVVLVLPHRRQVAPAGREGQLAHGAAVEAPEDADGLPRLGLPDHHEGLAPDLAGGHVLEGGVRGQAQHLVRVRRVEALGAAVRVQHHAQRGRRVGHAALRRVPHVVARVVAAVAVYPVQLQTVRGRGRLAPGRVLGLHHRLAPGPQGRGGRLGQHLEV
jgi:hypothetical protein